MDNLGVPRRGLHHMCSREPSSSLLLGERVGKGFFVRAWATGGTTTGAAEVGTRGRGKAVGCISVAVLARELRIHSPGETFVRRSLRLPRRPRVDSGALVPRGLEGCRSVRRGLRREPVSISKHNNNNPCQHDVRKKQTIRGSLACPRGR